MNDIVYDIVCNVAKDLLYDIIYNLMNDFIHDYGHDIVYDIIGLFHQQAHGPKTRQVARAVVAAITTVANSA